MTFHSSYLHGEGWENCKGTFVKIIGLTFCFGWASMACAQSPFLSEKGNFQVDVIRGCAPLTINIQNNLSGQCSLTEPCLMDFKEGSCPNGCQNEFTHTFQTPGVYSVEILYRYIGKDQIKITVDPPKPPPFNIFACAQNKVFLEITDTFYDSYAIDFDGDNRTDRTLQATALTSATFQYPNNQTYSVSVTGSKTNALANCPAHIENFTPKNNLPAPQLQSLTASDNTTLSLAYGQQSQLKFRVDISTNSASDFQIFQTTNTSPISIPNLSLDNQFYCVRMATVDLCAGGAIPSSPICSQKVTATFDNGFDKLNWATSTQGINSFSILRNNEPIGNVDASVNSYTDNNPICETNYCYQLVSQYDDGSTSTSLKKCGKAYHTYNPTAVADVSAIVNAQNTAVTLQWTTTGVSAMGFNISKQTPPNSYTLLKSNVQPPYVDDAYRSGEQYRVSYDDVCKNPTPDGISVKPLQLAGFVQSSTNAPSLVWNRYRGWSNGVRQYQIQKFDEAGSLLAKFSTLDTLYTDSQLDLQHQRVMYDVQALANDANLWPAQSNRVVIDKAPVVYWPTAFNPKSLEEVNRMFALQGQFIDQIEMQVYDRWGVLIFNTRDHSGWDGTRQGEELPEGVYLWKAVLTDTLGKSYNHHGVVMLVKK